MKTLKQKALLNTLWSFFEQLLRKGVTIMVTLGLAWFLAPEDFGLVAMMSIIFAISYAIIDGGFRAALIRKVEVTELELSTVFVTNVLLSMSLYCLLYITAPYIAEFYNEPRLIQLIRVASISVVIQSFAIIPQVLMHRRLLFKLQLKTSLPASVTSGVIAIILGYLGFGVWAIIAQMVSFALLNTVLLLALRLWKPPKFNFDFLVLKSLFKFSSFIMFDSILNAFFGKLYITIVAKFFSLTVAGLYFFASRINELVVEQLVSAIRQVSFPVLSKFQENISLLKSNYRKLIIVTWFITTPIFLTLFVMSPTLFSVIFPDKWFEAAELLQLMALVAVMTPLILLSRNILMIQEKSGLILSIGIYEKIIMLLILVITFEHGVEAIIMGQVFTKLIIYMVYIYYHLKLINYSFKEQVLDLLPILVISVVVTFTIHVCISYFNFSDYFNLIAFPLFGIAFYLLLAYFFKLRALNELFDLLKKNKSKAG